jgi:hypothetical protein
MRRIQYLCVPALAVLAVSACVAQSTTEVLVILKDQPQQQLPALTNTSNLLAARRAFTVAIQAATAVEQDEMQQTLTAFGATNIVPHTVINAFSVTVPASAVSLLQSNPAVAQVIPQTALSLFQLLDQTVTSTANTSISITLDSAMSDELAEIVDGIVDRYRLTLVVRGPPSALQNAITTAASAGPNGGTAPDFISADESALTNAIGEVQSAGVLDPLATRALLINTAGANAWNPLSGWGDVQPDAIGSLAKCVDQSAANTANESSSCFIGSVTGQQLYSTAGSGATKITLAWNRHIASDGTPVLNNLSLHVVDKSTGTEIANAGASGQSVQQVVASGSSGLMVTVQSNNPVQTGADAEPYALVSSTPLSTTSCQPGFFAYTPPTNIYPASGGTQNFTVNNTAGCSWNLSYAPGDGSDFLQFDQSVQTSTGSIALVAPANTTNQPLTQVVRILLNGFLYTTFSVSQMAGTGSNCTFSASLGANSSQFPYAGGSGTVTLGPVPSTCSYAFSSDSTWLSIASVGTGTSSTFSVAANTTVNGSTAQRTATITVVGIDGSGKQVYNRPMQVAENGQTCMFAVPNPIPDIPSAGVPAQSFTLKISDASCKWSATSTTAGFVVQNDGQVQSGTTAGTVTYSASKPNTTNAAIVGYLNVAGQSVEVKEDGGAPPPPPPPPPTFEVTVTWQLGDGTTQFPNSAKVTLTPSPMNSGKEQQVQLDTKTTKKTVTVPTGTYVPSISVSNAAQYETELTTNTNVTPQNPNVTYSVYRLVTDTVRVVSQGVGVPGVWLSIEGNPGLPSQQTDANGFVQVKVRQGVPYTVTADGINGAAFVGGQNSQALGAQTLFQVATFSISGTVTMSGYNDLDATALRQSFTVAITSNDPKNKTIAATPQLTGVQGSGKNFSFLYSITSEKFDARYEYYLTATATDFANNAVTFQKPNTTARKSKCTGIDFSVTKK